MSKNLIIAIDGPAGSGKSTSAKLVAQKLGFLYIDTGAMYRAITYLAIRNNYLGDEDKIIELTKNSVIQLDFINGLTYVKVNDEDLTDKIRTPEVNKNVSNISRIEGVRKILVKIQRQFGKTQNGIVMEGRDIATVVFTNADVKIFLTAFIDERAVRRAKEYAENGNLISVSEVKTSLQKRDIIDSNRKVSPLKQADDAIVVDTSHVTIEEQVNLILEEVKKAASKRNIEIVIN